MSALRIIHAVRSDAFAGVERYVCSVANGLAARGHRVLAIGGDPERMRAELEGVDHAPATGALGVWRQLVRAGPADVVHVHMSAAELAALAARPVNRASLVGTRHFPDHRLRALPPPFGRLVGRTLRAQISISAFVAQKLGEPSIVIHNGVGSKEQAPLVERLVVMLQRLQPEKAPELGLEAWARSGLAETGWKLIVAGSGLLEPPLRERVSALGLTDSVSLVGHVAATDELLAQASILLAPAPAEPFGLSVVEAMAHGVPVVAARGGAHPETLGEDGFLFEPGGADGAAAALAALAADAQLRKAEGRRLQQRQRALFSLSDHVERLERIYETVAR